VNRQNIEDIYPLSPMQHGMLFHTLYDAKSEVYLEQIHCILGDTLDGAAFERAFRALAQRHGILRTVFLWEGLEEPLQIVLKTAPLPFHSEDLRALSPEAQAARFAAFVEEDKTVRFELDSTPPQRFALFRVGEGTYRFLWSFHHLILDGWSLPVLMQDLFTFYDGYRKRLEPRLPRPKPFGDYIEWLGRQDMKKAEAFWRTRLKGFAAATPYRVDHAVADQHAATTFAEEAVSLGPDAAKRLFAFAREQKLTVSTLVRAAWSLLLMRYSGEEDVCFGATVSGRSAAVSGLESIVGMCINMMPVRAELSPGLTTLGWLTAFQDKQSELAEYEYSPLVEVQAWSEIPRGEPLFQSILTFENYPFDEAMLAGVGDVRVREFWASLGSNYPITVVCLPSDHDVAFRIVYDARRFDAPVAQRLAGHLLTLLGSLAQHAHEPVTTVPMLSAAERELLVTTWNQTSADCDLARPAHEVFADWALATPNAPAVSHEGTTLSYAELDAAANRLAHWLVKQGVKPDALVGIGLPPSEQVVVALLGIQKAGGAYVPIDPGLPDERIGHILDDTRALLVVTDAARAPRYERHGAKVLRVDADAALLAAESAAPLGRIAGPENLAYALFTSGSTGKSKGVLIEHKNLVQYVAGVASRLELPPGASYALVSTFAADLGNTVLYGSLLGGGHLHVMGEERTKDPHAIAEYFGRNAIDCLKIVPSHLSALLESPNAAAVVPHKCLVLGGEASSWELVDKLRALRPEHVLFNHYGPTETTVGVITNRVGERRSDAPIVPLGRPLPNTTLYVLDRHRNPAPLGVPGELFIGGAQVARGYLNRPELTDERFVPDHFSQRAGARLYRTGDSVKYLEDGTLLFLGRVDFQVKIRGYRIELGEIEAALRDNVSVREAVALVQDDGVDKRIIAFVVPMDPPAPPIATVREALAARVPDYMMPSALRWVEAVPLNANGKIDRQALFALEAQAEAAEAEGGGQSVAPRTPVEEVLAGIWADVFGLEKVGVHDNFNDLGGHSLVAIQVIARTRDALKVQVPLRAIFDSPTVAGLAERVETVMRAKQGLAVPPLSKAPEGPTPLSFAQERLWFLDQLEPGSAFYNVPAAIRLTGRVDVSALERAIGEVVRRHDALRTTFEATEGHARAFTHPWSPFRLDVLPAADEAEARAFAQKEAEKPFDLARGPLFRAALIRVGEATASGRELDHVLLFTMHHIVSDGWARGVLVRELAALYDAFAQNKPSPLDHLPFQYADFAHWQRSWLAGAVLEKELGYWKGKLAGAPAALELPTDRPRPPVQSFRGALHMVKLPAELGKATHAFAKGEGATLFMVLFAAWTTLLSRYARQTDVVVGSPIAGRSQSSLEGLIGFFVNTLVLRTDLSGEPTFKDVVKRVREAALGAYAHQDLPFERLVEALSPERDLSRSPLFQVMFVLQNAPLPPLSLPGLMLSPLETDSGTAKFDLTLTVAELPSGELAGGFEYNTDLFDEATIAKLGEHFGVLLAAALAEPKKRVAELPLMLEAERSQLATELAGTSAPLPEGALITDLIELEGSKAPGALAVTFEDQELSYGALISASRQVARALQTRGVGAGSRVALSVERSPEMIVGILGVLLAGAAYVPFDPAWPKDRLAFVLADADVKWLLTQERLLPSLEGLSAERLVLDGASPFFAEASDAPVPRVATPDSAAYVIYTSGSTGRPKGVAVSHENLVYSTLARFGFYEAAPLRAFLLLSSFSFDSSVAGIFWSLASGATLVLPREGITDDPRAIVALVRYRAVSHLLAVPSLYGVLLGEAEAGALDSLRAAIVAGEAVLPDLVARHHARLPSARLYNEYGPTEASVWCIAADLGPSDARGRVPIGRPIPNARIYLLDERLAPVPVGVPGEIVVGGPGVTSGYLNLPEETAARFVASPFGEGRLYRTGDLGRFRRDGTIEFLGARRPAGQDPRLSHRDRGDRGRVRGPPGRARGGRGRPRGSPGRQTPRGLLRVCRRAVADGGRAAHASPEEPARIHGAAGDPRAARHARHRDGQARSQGAARPRGARGDGGHVRRAA
jgi:amino acid adenylation domain-containing protein